MDEFQLLASRIDRRYLVNKYIDRFGSEGDLSDFAILVSLGRHGVPSQSASSGLASQDQEATLNEEIDFYRSQQLLVAESQCRHFLRNRDSLKRYAHFLVWAGFLVSEFDIDLPESKSVKHPFPNWSEKLPIAGMEFRAIFDRRILLPREIAP